MGSKYPSVITSCIFRVSTDKLEPLMYYGGEFRRCAECGNVEFAQGCVFYGGSIDMCTCYEPYHRLPLRQRLLRRWNGLRNRVWDARYALARWILPPNTYLEKD